MTPDLDAIAAELAEALAAPRQIQPFSQRADGLTLQQGYRVAARLRETREQARVGRKVGFTNRAIWPVYGVDGPMWGDITQGNLLAAGGRISLAPWCEPRIEPEIVLHLGSMPVKGMDDAALAACVDWVAPAFEIVQSVYSGWALSAGDAAAAQGMHGCLVIGEKRPADATVLKGLTQVPVALSLNGQEQATGVGANALDGPLSVLRCMVEMLPDPPDCLQAGELVSTGTLVDPPTIEPGQHWSARFGGVLDTEIAVELT